MKPLWMLTESDLNKLKVSDLQKICVILGIDPREAKWYHQRKSLVIRVLKELKRDKRKAYACNLKFKIN